MMICHQDAPQLSISTGNREPLAIWLTCVCRPTPCMVASNYVPRRLGLCWSRVPGLLPVSAASSSMDHEYGTVCQPILEHQIQLNGLAPSYLASDLQRVVDLGARRRLRSASTSTLVVPATCLSTVGDHAFPVAAARVWNSLPADVTSSPSLPTFQRWLKTELFARSYS